VRANPPTRLKTSLGSTPANRRPTVSADVREDLLLVRVYARCGPIFYLDEPPLAVRRAGREIDPRPPGWCLDRDLVTKHLSTIRFDFFCRKPHAGLALEDWTYPPSCRRGCGTLAHLARGACTGIALNCSFDGIHRGGATSRGAYSRISGESGDRLGADDFRRRSS
jgi:hypothetical protein